MTIYKMKKICFRVMKYKSYRQLTLFFILTTGPKFHLIETFKYWEEHHLMMQGSNLLSKNLFFTSYTGRITQKPL